MEPLVGPEDQVDEEGVRVVGAGVGLRLFGEPVGHIALSDYQPLHFALEIERALGRACRKGLHGFAHPRGRGLELGGECRWELPS